jgi:hypothetical protein
LIGDICGNIADMLGHKSFVRPILMTFSVIPLFLPLVGVLVLLWKHEFFYTFAILYKLFTICQLIQFEYRFWKWKELTEELIESLPMATDKDIERESICLICRGEMTVIDASKINCGHCLHTTCLRSWVKRQTVCPICGQRIGISK